MSTTLLAAQALLSKELGDYYVSTTDGAGTSTTLVDSALKAYANDWIQDWCWVMLEEEPTGAAAIYDERKVSSLDNTSGTLTTLAFAAAPGTGIDFSLHRLFKPSDKKLALLAACYRSYPDIFDRILDESFVSKNWIKGNAAGFEVWSATTTLTGWTTTSVTTTQTSTAGYVKTGTYSCKLSGTAGNIAHTISDNADLMKLAGKHVKFSVQGHSNTADSLRIGILYDGTNYEYSDYHDGDTAWTKNSEPIEVEYDIDDNPTNIGFYIYHDDDSGTEYVDDARVVSSSPDSPRIYIGHLGLVQNTPTQIFVEPSDYSLAEPWTLIHGADIDYEGGYLYLPSSVQGDLRLRIKGVAMLDFLASGSSSTAWTATINLDSPQLEILVAEAALYLYTWMVLPNFESGTTQDYQQMMAYWGSEVARRKAKFGMQPIPITAH